jgi:aldehyde:ferredoxin oxidoreductase
VTGWNWTLDDAFRVGRRVVNLLRVFNLAHGLSAEDERPSKRYGSVPVDGPAQGKDIMAQWPAMVANYYRRMGWDEKTGRPLPKTLEELGLGEFV